VRHYLVVHATVTGVCHASVFTPRMTRDCGQATPGDYHLGVRMRSWVLVAAVAVVIAFAACGGGTASTAAPSSLAPPSVAPSSPPPSAEASPSATSAIVGEWVGVHDCERIVAMLGDAGLDEFLADAVYGNGLIPGVDPSTAALKDPSKPCDGAVERQHSHFFTAAGEFGSRDFHGNDVDDGSYTLDGEDVIVINDKRFKYEIQGDELSLEPEPVDISKCTTKECRFVATWVLMVAMPGTTWTRGEITPS
jgi:hypothetical protein